LLTENEKEYGKGHLKYKEQKNAAWIGGAMDILDEKGDIVVSSTNMYRYLSTRFFFKTVYITGSSAMLDVLSHCP
jgi:hypothetical protein